MVEHYLQQIEESEILDKLGLAPGGYFLVSAHREENVDNPRRLGMLLECLAAVHDKWGVPLIVSTHPRTRKRGWMRWAHRRLSHGIRFMEPFGFHEYNKLQLAAKAVLSDSGTISEEAAALGFPAITLRESIERPEALEAGTIMMTGGSKRDVLGSLEVLFRPQEVNVPRTSVPHGCEVTDTSERVTRFILSTAGRHHEWSGIRMEPQ